MDGGKVLHAGTDLCLSSYDIHKLWPNLLLSVCCTKTSEKSKVPSSSISIVKSMFTMLPYEKYIIRPSY